MNTDAAVVLLAATTGARSMTGVAAAGYAGRGRDRRGADVIEQPARALAGAGVRRAVTTFAVAELVADKLPGIPDRIAPHPLFGRAVAGALVGATIAALDGRGRTRLAMLGAVTAIDGAQLSFLARRRLSRITTPFAAAVIEDVLVLAAAAAGVALLGRDR